VHVAKGGGWGGNLFFGVIVGVTVSFRDLFRRLYDLADNNATTGWNMFL